MDSLLRVLEQPGTANLLRDAGAILSALVTMAAVLFAAYQYRSAQMWHRAEFVLTQIRDLESNTLTYNAMRLLDSPGQSIELFPSDPNRKARVVKITPTLIAKALQNKDGDDDDDGDDDGDDGDEPDLTLSMIRNCIDHFLDVLARYENLIIAGLATAEHFQPYLLFWLTLMSGKDGKMDGNLRDTIWTYIDDNSYGDVRKLFNRYAITQAELPRATITDRLRHWLQMVAGGLN